MSQMINMINMQPVRIIFAILLRIIGIIDLPINRQLHKIIRANSGHFRLLDGDFELSLLRLRELTFLKLFLGFCGVLTLYQLKDDFSDKFFENGRVWVGALLLHEFDL